MKKYLFALLLASCFITPVFADTKIEDTEDDEVELNAFGFPDKSFVKLIETKQLLSSVDVREKPECDNAELIKKAQQAVKPFVNSIMNTIFNRRRNILITKNIDNFNYMSIEEAMNLENRIVKAKLTELKINNKLSNENFKICQSNNHILKDKLFILMYDDNNNVKVDILNMEADETPSFYFYDK